ncbi:flagellar hook-associated protein FlgK [Rhodoplanes sp. TEM]|uniref:Flagellar hook-associated protein 1 n=1 Tax=Rhodoplanes tepidamans TaxID=200616 RepID=A0ABT5JAQ9_RHOTP|nr:MULTISPECIES: flagellar hook-associated protein FlgK [Rhodoplanes]MDC7786744.1 flagellar hook-associated protein FlgK [Rhodoplanes tepidamans]MDC7983750.1 flagellar hook-associated protein FlgK [Rhodoplanes sp. TEM]MDQ0358181.1 flagellar hook-associated protein 1 FlgK [Rhodoplanes tepidamans]
MSLTQALGTAAAGLKTAQGGLSLVAANVANAQTPGYVRKTTETATIAAGGDLVSVRLAAVNRIVDQYVQRQLRTEASGGSYAELRSLFYDRLQNIYADPNSATSIESVYNDFTTALQALTTNPSDYSTRVNVLSTAQAMAQQLNNMSADIQALRENAEQGLADCIRNANTCLQGLAKVNTQLTSSHIEDATRASLLDQRDYYLDQLSELMDIRVTEDAFDSVTVFTSSGIQLAGAEATTLSFDAQGMMSPGAQWSADPAKRQVGTIVVTNSAGGTMDLIETRSFRSGEIAAYLEMRDKVLVEAQTQLDELAASISRALSDVTTAGTPVTSGAQAGFDLDVSGLLAGNSVKVSWTDTLTGKLHSATLVRVDDPGALPLSDSLTSDPNDKVIGIDFSGGLAAAVAQMNAAFTGQVQFSNPSGTTLRVLDDGAASTADLVSASVTKTQTSLTGGTAELPFFMDGAQYYSGAVAGSYPQSVGFAGRITINPALLADPSRLVVYDTGTTSADQTRPNFLYDRLTTATQTFAPQTGIGSQTAPFSGSISSFLRQTMAQQGENAAGAAKLAEGQTMVVDALQQRLNEGAAVNIDEEMTTLLTLQTAYGANARVFSVVNEMLKTLLQMM